MKRYLPVIVIAALLLVAIAATVFAEEKKVVKKYKYVGLTACKACHSNAKIGGTEYKAFEKVLTRRHSRH